MQTIKVCSKCGETKPATEEYFYKSTQSKCGLVASCKQCEKAYKLRNKDRIKMLRQKNHELNKTERNEKHRAWYQANKEHARAYAKEYALKNKESIRAYYQSKYYKTKEEYLLKAKTYRNNNKARCYERSKKYRQKNAETISEKAKKRYYKKHETYLSTARKWNQRRRTAKISLPATLTEDQWCVIVQLFDNKCAYCGKTKKLEQDHFVALSNGGEYSHNNIVPSCHSCNTSKKNNDFFEWYPKQGHYSKKREAKILKFLHYENNRQQLSFPF